MFKRILLPLAFLFGVGAAACDRPDAHQEDVDGAEIQAPGYSDPNPNMPDTEMDTVGRDTSMQ